MKTIKEFLKWLVINNTISLVYYLILTILLLAIIHEKQSIIDNNSEEVFKLVISFPLLCILSFTLLSVIPEYKKRND
jgi:flagellar biosynthesis protein FlhB